ncbi:MAG TPA: zinc-binding dehydrogenase [Dongiaceae bacterium]|nr:zinc-binding dehydrogenase [Dongiaceae bacterium]
MRALRLIEDGRLELGDLPEPEAPGAGEVVVRMRAVALNHIDLWGFRGMAFARRKLPIIVGVEGAGEIAAVGEGVGHRAPGDRVALYAGVFCGRCGACRRGQENLCENIGEGGIMGFHRDGVAAQYVRLPARQTVPVPAAVQWAEAATAPVTFATVQHMLFDNAKLQAGETILVHAAASGIGTTAVLMAKAVGARVLATVGSEEKMDPVRALGADEVLNYRKDRFETWARRQTGKKGVDVVFEHVGPDTWAGSLLSLKRGGRLVTCGSTSGISAETNLFQLFQQQIRIIASFGASIRNLAEGLNKMARREVLPVIDSEIGLDEFDQGLKRMAARAVIGKIIVHIP